jgi:hypothetical protein
LNVGLSGNGVAPGQLSLSPSTYNFGNVNVGASAVMTGTLTASGSAITISSASGTSSEFSLSGIAFPITIARGQSIPFTTTFTPQISGTASDSVTFSSNAANGPVMQALSGTGIASGPHSVDLSWDASGTPGIVGYNVYRSSASGGPYSLLTTSPDPSLLFSDTTVTAGQTYYYAVTALNSAGTESPYSNQVVAIVPSP